MAEVMNLMDMSPDEVEQAYQAGSISGEEVDVYIARKELAERGLLGMSPESVETAYQRGILSGDQVDAYLERHENPVLFYLKDIGRAVLGGATDAAENVFESAVDLARWGTPSGVAQQVFFPDSLASMSGDELTDMAYKQLKKFAPEVVETVEDVTTTYSTPGHIVKPLAQFAMPFGIAGKAMKSGQTVQKIMSSGALRKLAERSPKLAKFAAESAEATLVRGPLVDYSAFDPLEKSLFDMLEEHTDIADPVLEYLKTDPDNPAAVERLKQTLEGMVVGFAFDSVFAGLKGLKGRLWRKAGHKELKVLQEVDEKFTKPLGKETKHPIETDNLKPSNRLRDPEEPATAAEAQTGTEGSAQAEAQVPARKRTIQAKEEDLTATSHKLIQDVVNERDFDLPEDDLLAKMEFEGSEETLIRAIRGYRAEDIHKARGSGPVSLEKTEKRAQRQLAYLTGKGTEEAMEASRKLFGEAQDLHVKVRALNKFFMKYADAIARKLDDSTSLSFEDELRLVQHLKNLQELQSIVYGVRSEMGRGLNQYNLPWTIGSQWDLDKLPRETLEDIQKADRARVQKILKTYKNAKDPAMKMNIARSVGHHGIGEGILEFIQANLLWNPATHITNILGGSLAQLNNSMKRYAGLRTEAIIKRNPEVLKEWEAYKHGIKVGLIEAFRLPGVDKQNFKNPKVLLEGAKEAWTQAEGTGRFWKALFTGEPQLDPLVKLEGQNQPGIRNWLDKLNNPKGFRLPLGTLLKLPFYGLTAGDEFMKHIGYFSELHAQAVREGMNQGLSGKQLDDFVKTVTTGGITPQLHYKALANAREITFTEALGPASQSINNALNTSPGLVFKIAALPFYKIVVNLTKYSARNSPLGLASKRVRDAIKAGGKERYEAIAGIVQGTAMMGLAATLYEMGLITGRVPSDMRDTYSSAGIQEYSAKIGDKWVSYKRLDPLAFLLGASADIARAIDMSIEYGKQWDEEDQMKFEEVITAYILALSEPVLKKTMMESVGEFLNIVLNPDRKDFKGYIYRDQLAKFLPAMTLGGHVQRLMSETQKEVETFKDLLQSKYWSKGMFPRRHNVYGTPLEAEDAWPAPVLGTFRTKEASDDPVMQELVRVGANVPPPSRTLQRDNISIELDQEQYAQLNDYIAQLPLQEQLLAIINSDQYKNNLNDEDKARVLKNTINDARNVAREMLLGKNKKLRQDFIARFQERAKARAGIEEKRDVEGKIAERFLDEGR